ncbi:MAG: ribonuclease P protein component [Anaerotruncus sp.]|nr:ribonuclease P protein component [Anaerotruncus sp.]
MHNTTSLKLNKEFRRAYYRGKSCATPVVVVYAVKNRLRKNQVGLTATKKIGKAVQRNRARRIIKEAYRLIENEFPIGWDFVFVARTKTVYSNTNDVILAMRTALKKLFPR